QWDSCYGTVSRDPDCLPFHGKTTPSIWIQTDYYDGRYSRFCITCTFSCLASDLVLVHIKDDSWDRRPDDSFWYTNMDHFHCNKRNERKKHFLLWSFFWSWICTWSGDDKIAFSQ